MRLFSLPAAGCSVLVAAACCCFLAGIARADDKPQTAGIVRAGCPCDSCTCKPGFCPGACPVIAVYNGERFGYESIILERKNGRTEIGVTNVGVYPPRVVALGFSDVLRVLADNPFAAAPCPGGAFAAGTRVAAVAGSSAFAAPAVSSGVRPVRRVFQNRPRIFGRRGCASCGG